MTYIIVVYDIFTSDMTYLSFAAIARCSIPVEKPPAFLNERLDLTIVPYDTSTSCIQLRSCAIWNDTAPFEAPNSRSPSSLMSISNVKC